jgi:phenylacetic acid degradation operon negative regulatory protein
VTQRRKPPAGSTATTRSGTGTGAGPAPADVDLGRPLSARSVIASTLLGMEDPRLPVALLVRSGELFGIAEGTTRVALSRMAGNGELEAADGSYRLAGRLLERHRRQAESRQPRRSARWSGAWEMAVVAVDRRGAADRAELRDAMRRLQLAELREGVWLRPDNLDPDRFSDARAVVDAQCRRFSSAPTDHDPARLAAELWDLDGWAKAADDLGGRLRELQPTLDRGDTDALAPGFVVSAAVLRHLLADPRLPAALLPDGWPGDALRVSYDRYDAAFKRVWRDWFRTQQPAS